MDSQGTIYSNAILITVSVSLAVLPVGDLGPVADAAVLVEPEAGGAGVLLGLPVHAGVEDVADGGVRVGVETIETRAEVAGTLGLLCTVRSCTKDYGE